MAKYKVSLVIYPEEGPSVSLTRVVATRIPNKGEAVTVLVNQLAKEGILKPNQPYVVGNVEPEIEFVKSGIYDAKVKEITEFVKSIELKVQEEFPAIKCILQSIDKETEDIFKILIYSPFREDRFIRTLTLSYSIIEERNEIDFTGSIALQIIEEIKDYKRKKS